MRHITIITSSPHDSTIHIMSTDICTEVGALFSSCTCCAFVIKFLVVDKMLHVYLDTSSENVDRVGSTSLPSGV